jgi:protein-L-isoaspartate(D-aspartate) O-methyltransferase
MIDSQLVSRGINDQKVLSAMGRIDRKNFVPDILKLSAYDDNPLPIGEGQTISQPYMVAKMTQLLDPDKKSRVLEVGTGSGYQTAVLCELLGFVYSVEIIRSFSDKAEHLLRGLGYANFELKTGDGSEGWEERAPFDRIIVAAAAESIPMAFLDQLAGNGKLVMPVGNKDGQRLKLIEKIGGELSVSDFDDCVFVPLIHANSW